MQHDKKRSATMDRRRQRVRWQIMNAMPRRDSTAAKRSDKNFLQVTDKGWRRLIKLVDEKPQYVELFCLIVANMDATTNMFAATQSAFAESAGIKPRTLARHIRGLIEFGCISKNWLPQHRSLAYRVDPEEFCQFRKVKKFTQVTPQGLQRICELCSNNHTAARLFVFLASHIDADQGALTVGQKYLGKILNVSVRTISRAVAYLVEQGAIVTTNLNGDTGNSGGRELLYSLNPHEIWISHEWNKANSSYFGCADVPRPSDADGIRVRRVKVIAPTSQNAELDYHIVVSVPAEGAEVVVNGWERWLRMRSDRLQIDRHPTRGIIRIRTNDLDLAEQFTKDYGGCLVSMRVANQFLSGDNRVRASLLLQSQWRQSAEFA